jgi:hypothetical protein
MTLLFCRVDDLPLKKGHRDLDFRNLFDFNIK